MEVHFFPHIYYYIELSCTVLHAVTATSQSAVVAAIKTWVAYRKQGWARMVDNSAGLIFE